MSVKSEKSKTALRGWKFEGLPQTAGISKIQKRLMTKTVIHDVHHFATLQNIGNYEIEPLIQRLDLADINDCLYYDYCLKEHIEFYTFDSDLEKIDRNKKYIVTMLKKTYGHKIQILAYFVSQNL